MPHDRDLFFGQVTRAFKVFGDDGWFIKLHFHKISSLCSSRLLHQNFVTWIFLPFLAWRCHWHLIRIGILYMFYVKVMFTVYTSLFSISYPLFCFSVY